jgi:ABC-type Co2+ transport system permease subunit
MIALLVRQSGIWSDFTVAATIVCGVLLFLGLAVFLLGPAIAFLLVGFIEFCGWIYDWLFPAKPGTPKS